MVLVKAPALIFTLPFLSASVVLSSAVILRVISLDEPLPLAGSTESQSTSGVAVQSRFVVRPTACSAAVAARLMSSRVTLRTGASTGSSSLHDTDATNASIPIKRCLSFMIVCFGYCLCVELSSLQNYQKINQFQDKSIKIYWGLRPYKQAQTPINFNYCLNYFNFGRFPERSHTASSQPAAFASDETVAPSAAGFPSNAC